MTDYDGSPFHIIDNIYYIGTDFVSSHIFTSKEGHILLDTCWPDSGPGILNGVTELGFSPKDIRYLVISHAHIDHLGSTALLAKETGATICVGEADVEAAEKGSTTQAGLVGFETFKVHRPLKEGDVIAVGGRRLHVYHTPGHTPGCCSFGFKVQDENRTYRGMLFGGAGLNVFEEENLKRNIYGGTIEDLRKSLERMLRFDAKVWLGNHPFHNDTFQKLEHLRQGIRPNPYIDPDGWKAFLTARLVEVEELLSTAR